MRNGRCRKHGGKTPVTPTGILSPAYTHGIYTKFFRDDEKVLLDAGAIRLGEVDDELKVMRIRLKRALEAKEKWEAEAAGLVEGADAETSMTSVEVTNDETVTKDGDIVPTVKKIKRLPDFDSIIDRMVGRIESLEKTRKELQKAPEPGDPEGGDGAPATHHVTFTGGLTGIDGPLPEPFGADADGK